MEQVKELARWIACRFFGATYVMLIDHDGEVNVRRVKFVGSKSYASRYPFKIRDIWLSDNGELRNGNYVQSWEPYLPMSSKQWPIPKTYPNTSKDKVMR